MLDPPPPPLDGRRSRIWDSGTLEQYRKRTKKIESGCLIWEGRYDPRGHPRLWLKKGKGYAYAARVAWEVEHGRKLLQTELVQSSCPSGRRCVFHEHLYVVHTVGRSSRDQTPQLIVNPPPAPDVGVKVELLLKHLAYTVRSGERTRAGLVLMQREYDKLRHEVGASLARVETAILLQREEFARVLAAFETLRSPTPELTPSLEAVVVPHSDPIAEEEAPASALAVYYRIVAHDGMYSISEDDERTLGAVLDAALGMHDADHEAASRLYATWLHAYTALTPEPVRSTSDFLRYVTERIS